ncbi:MAG: hypothetical protein C5B46_07435 [Proteobacteria bacterium]|nr:MAG: hypothetical protein C5B46_07435 [Pseudomonadota bacterium]
MRMKFIVAAVVLTALPVAALPTSAQPESAEATDAVGTARDAPTAPKSTPGKHTWASRQLTEEQAVRALELDLSRNVGKTINESDFPEEARRWKWSGTTIVQVLMGADGSMKEVTVHKTSGFRALDEQALRVVRRIVPPEVPERLRGREVAVTVPIGFYLGSQ